ncbi:MAG: hypothetical protein M3463_01045 [Verrucomicrobiota bacterium]|nr:hypothetical protein [Verrucomicrobiota bacterium]
MNFEKVANHFRSTTAPLAVSGIVIVSDDGDFTADGKIQREGDAIHLEVILKGERELPAIGGTYRRDQFWKIGGVIEEQVPFWAVGFPIQHGRTAARFTIRTARFEFDKIHHLTAPFAQGGLRDAVLQAAHSSRLRKGEPVRGYAFARLADYKLICPEQETVTVEENQFVGKIIQRRRDTLCGEIDNFEYGLIQCDADCEVHVRLKEDTAEPPGELGQVMQAMYRALAFLHGRHSRPQWERIADGTGAVAEFTTAPRAVSENMHTLLTNRTAKNGSRPTALIEKLLRCFLREDAFSEGLGRYLFLAREAAGFDTPAHVSALGLCAVWEGFVGFLHEHFCASGGAPHDAEFEKARSALVQFAKEQAAEAGISPAPVAAWTRLIGMVSSAHSLRPADKYQQLSEHFRLRWDKMLPALAAWQKHRHPLAHGAATHDDRMNQLFVTSRIAGAINVLAGAAVGYSGLAVLSRTDNRYIQLP